MLEGDGHDSGQVEFTIPTMNHRTLASVLTTPASDALKSELGSPIARQTNRAHRASGSSVIPCGPRCDEHRECKQDENPEVSSAAVGSLAVITGQVCNASVGCTLVPVLRTATARVVVW